MLIVMLKTRLFPDRKVLSDRSDIVALHANFLRRTDECAHVRNAQSDSARSKWRHSADIRANVLPSSTSNTMFVSA